MMLMRYILRLPYINNVDDTHTRNKYNTEGLSLGDFRRKQIDLFIEDLYNTMRNNLQNNRVSSLGISQVVFIEMVVMFH